MNTIKRLFKLVPPLLRGGSGWGCLPLLRGGSGWGCLPLLRGGSGWGCPPSLLGRAGVGLLVGLLLSLSWCSLHAQQLQRYNPHFHLSAKNFCDTIPIIIEDDLILLPVTIGDQQFRFLLDTGSSQGMVYANTDVYPLVTLGNIISRDANNHQDTVQVVQLPPFTLNTLPSSARPAATLSSERTINATPITISGYVASLMPRDAVSSKYDAVIGFDLFNRGLCAKIDRQQSVLILSDNKKAFRNEEKLGHTLRYKLKWFVPYLYVSPFVRHTDEALFDTGSTALYTMSRQSFDEHVAADLANLSKQLGADIERQVEGRAQGHLSIGGFGIEEKDEIVFLHLDRLKWADFSFTDLHAISTQGASKIGSQILSYGSILINPFRKRITFLPYSTVSDSLPTGEGQGGAPSSVQVANRQLGVAFVPQQGRAAVGLIWDQSQPYQAGMRQGDIILQIDQRLILTFADFLRFRFVKGEPHTFRLLTADGTEKTVTCIIKE